MLEIGQFSKLVVLDSLPIAVISLALSSERSFQYQAYFTSCRVGLNSGLKSSWLLPRSATHVPFGPWIETVIFRNIYV